MNLTELSVVKRALNDGTLKQGVLLAGTVYALHVTRNREVIITDMTDYTKIYAVLSLELYQLIEQEKSK